MILDFCVACGEEDLLQLENHHLVPLGEGGPDVETNLITLCYECHGKAHGMIRKDIRQLTKEGIARAVARRGGHRPHGDHKFTNEETCRGNKISHITRKKNTQKNDERVFPIIQEIINNGIITPWLIAKELHRREVPTMRSKKWGYIQVQNIMKRNLEKVHKVTTGS